MCGVLREFREVENSRGTTMRNWKSLPPFAFLILLFLLARGAAYSFFFTTDGRISLPPFPTFSLPFLSFSCFYIPLFLTSPRTYATHLFQITQPLSSLLPTPHLSNFSPHPTSPTSPHFFSFCFPILSCFKPFSRITPPPDTCHLLLQVSAQCPGT